MKLDQWAEKWTINKSAVEDLKTILGIFTTSISSAHDLKDDIKSEALISSLVRLEANRKGLRLWRNNVGATYTKTGDFLRYGLANDSMQLNKKIKSGDLIGIKPIEITSNMVGKIIGQFISREIKSPSWKFSGTEREIAQLAWAELILSLGGDACFCTGEGTF